MSILRKISPRNRHRATFASAAFIAGGLLLAAPAGMASAAPDPTPDQAIGTIGTNINNFVGTLGTNINNFVGTAGTNVNNFVGTGGNNVNSFVGTLGTNGLVFAGTLGNNLVGNPPNTGGATARVAGTGARVASTGGMRGNFQCNSTGASSCAR